MNKQDTIFAIFVIAVILIYSVLFIIYYDVIINILEGRKQDYETAQPTGTVIYV